jgi:hypothetical protein
MVGPPSQTNNPASRATGDIGNMATLVSDVASPSGVRPGTRPGSRPGSHPSGLKPPSGARFPSTGASSTPSGTRFPVRKR